MRFRHVATAGFNIFLLFFALSQSIVAVSNTLELVVIG